jgi:LysM repeat protein
MLRSISRFSVWLAIGVLAATLPIGLVTARSIQPQSSELLTNPGFEEPFSGQGLANSWQAWYLTPDGVTYPTTCGNRSSETCKPYGIPGYRPAQPQDERVPPRSMSGNAQKWGASYYVYIAGIYQQVSGLTPGARLQFSAFTQAFNCSNDQGCFGGAGDYGYSYEAGDNALRVGIDPTGGTDPFSSNIVWSSYANPLDAFAQQTVEAVAQGDKATVFVWSAPQYPQKHLETFVDNASLVVTGQGEAPTTAPTIAAGTPAPTVTISPDAATYAVAAGDTLSIIAQRFNLTLDQLLALNPSLTRESVIQVGQVINVAGQVPTLAATSAPSATPLPSLTPAPTATSTPEAQLTVTPAATSLTATPLVVAASSGLCLQAFDDLNNNLMREADEPLVADVVFDVTSVDGKTSVDYTTTGTQEPHCFSTLPDGRYAVNTQLPADRTATTDSAWQMSLLAGTNVSIILGTRANEPPTPEPTLEPTFSPTTAAAPVNSGNSSAPIALLGGGALLRSAGGALGFGLRSRSRAV